MKTKIKKDWHNREKSVEEIHDDSKHWKSEIDFINDELRFLEHLISSHYINFMDSGLKKNIEDFSKKIHSEQKIGNSLYKLINKHEKILSDLIETESVTSNLNYIDTHNQLEKEVRIYFRNHKKLKKTIFSIVEEIIKKKGQKKIS